MSNRQFIPGLRTAVTAILFTFFVSAGSAQWSSSPRTMVFSSSSRQGRLGVSIQDVSKELKKRHHLSVDEGAYVSGVEDESPADKADIREGDVIVRFGDEKIQDAADLTNAVRKAKPKSDVKVEIVRKDEHKTVTATIGRTSAHSYSYSFGGTPMPRIPMVPHAMHMFSMNEFQGLTVEDLSKQLAEYFEVPGNKGVLVTDVESGSAADKAGFKAGDVIVKAGGNTVRRSEDLRDELSDREDSNVAVDVLRKGKTVTLSLSIEREEGYEGDEDESSREMNMDLQHSAASARELSRRVTQEALHSLRESIRKLQSEIREGVREFRQDVRSRFSNM